MASKSGKSLAFKCHQCYEEFRTDKFDRVDFPERDYHPYDYLAKCPTCGAEEVRVVAWQAALFKAWVNATGPRTEEGKKRDWSLTRFNAITHGLTAKVAQYYPAKPGSYPHCEGCEWLNDGCGTVNRVCFKRTELFVRNRVAAEDGDTKPLKEQLADNQAAVQGILEDMMAAITRRGVEVHEPITNFNPKTGKVEVATILDEDGTPVQLTRIMAHPLIKPMIELMQKNNMSLADMMLTQKQQGEDAKLQGFLDDESEQREDARKRQEMYEKRQARLLELVEAGDKAMPNNVLSLNGDDG